MKMTARDRIIVLILILAAVIYGGYQLLWIPSSDKISALEKFKAEIQGLTADITPLLKQSETMRTENETLKKSIDDIKMAGGKTLTKEEFLLYLGKCATANSVKLLGFSDLGAEDSNGIYKAKFNFELQGSAASINTTLADIDKMGIRYSVGSVSYRQIQSYGFLTRFFDRNTELPWYKEPKKKDEQQDEALLPPEETPILLQPNFPEVLPPVPELVPDIQPSPTPDIQAPTEEPKDKSITDRLDELLEQTRFSGKFKVVLLTNVQEPDDSETIAGDDMRLAVTLCFLMFEKPDISNSFMTQQSEGL